MQDIGHGCGRAPPQAPGRTRKTINSRRMPRKDPWGRRAGDVVAALDGVAAVDGVAAAIVMGSPAPRESLQLVGSLPQQPARSIAIATADQIAAIGTLSAADGLATASCAAGAWAGKVHSAQAQKHKRKTHSPQAPTPPCG